MPYPTIMRGLPLRTTPTTVDPAHGETANYSKHCLTLLAPKSLFKFKRMEISKYFAQQPPVAHYAGPARPAPSDSNQNTHPSEYFIQQPPAAPVSKHVHQQSTMSHWARSGHRAPKPDSNEYNQVSKYFIEQPPPAPVTPKPHHIQVSKQVRQQSPIAPSTLKFDDFGILCLCEPHSR